MLRDGVFELAPTFIVESPLPDAPSVLPITDWVPVALIVAALLWVYWKTRGKSTE